MWTLPTSLLWSPGTGLSGDVPQYHELRPAWLLLCRFALWIDSCLHPGAGASCSCCLFIVYFYNLLVFLGTLLSTLVTVAH